MINVLLAERQSRTCRDHPVTTRRVSAMYDHGAEPWQAGPQQPLRLRKSCPDPLEHARASAMPIRAGLEGGQANVHQLFCRRYRRAATLPPLGCSGRGLLARVGPGSEADLVSHLDAAYNLARWLVRDPELASDVVQEAFLRALRYHHGLRGDPKPWLLKIVRNVAYSMLAERRKFAEVPLECDDADKVAEDDPHAALERVERLQSLDRRLAALPLEQRECLILREVEELSYKEIATVTGVAVGTVMSRLWRARKTLLDIKP